MGVSTITPTTGRRMRHDVGQQLPVINEERMLLEML